MVFFFFFFFLLFVFCFLFFFLFEELKNLNCRGQFLIAKHTSAGIINGNHAIIIRDGGLLRK